MSNYKFHLVRIAHLDYIVFPVSVSFYVISNHYDIFLYSSEVWPKNITNYRTPWALITLLVLILSFLNSVYLRKGENLLRLSRYLKLRLILQTLLMVGDLRKPTIKREGLGTVWGAKTAIIGLAFLYLVFSSQALLERVEMLNYHHLKEFKMDKIYRGKWTMMRAPVIFYLYCQIIIGVRYSLHSVVQFFLAASLPSAQEALRSDALFTIIFIMSSMWGPILTLNCLLLLAAIRKKSAKLLVIYYHLKTWVLLIWRISFLAALSLQFVYFADVKLKPTNLSNSPASTFPKQLQLQFQILLEFLELSHVLRLHTYITLESEMSVGDYSFKLCGQFRNFFKVTDKDAKRFLNSIKIASWRVSCDGSMLGEGNFSKVYKGFISHPVSCQNTPIAIKVLNSQNSNELESFESTLSELKTLSLVSAGHPALVKFLGICKLRNSQLDGQLGILSEFMEAGCLLDILLNMQNPEMETLSTWSQEIADGMDFLSLKKIVHGDLAARNILLTSNRHCKISDFGMSFRLYQYQTYTRSTQTMMPFRWMAPESLSDLKFSSESDVWSYGVLVWEIFSLGSVPWGCFTVWSGEFISDLKLNLRLAKPILATEKIYFNLMMECWKHDPRERKTFREIKLFWEMNDMI